MLAMLGYGAQATLTQEGPFKNLVDHLSDPVNNNILTNFGARVDRGTMPDGSLLSSHCHHCRKLTCYETWAFALCKIVRGLA